MDDRSEKIIMLAQELLRANASVETGPPANASVRHPFLVFLFVALLAAIGGSTATQWIDATRRPIDRSQRTTIEALLLYAAKVNGLNETALREEVASRLHLTSLDDMTVSEYRSAQRYLQDKAR